MTRRTSSITIFLVIFLVICLGAPFSAGAWSDPSRTGPWKLGFTHINAVDAARSNRPVPMDIWYPVDDEDWVDTNFKIPLWFGFGPKATYISEDADVSDVPLRKLIVFSHGYESLALQSSNLMEHLASHGFIVVAPTHTGNTFLDTSSVDPAADRLPDISFVIDTMESKNNDAGDPFYGRVHTNYVGVAGHSYGGLTSVMTASGYNGTPADDRVGAIMPISASGTVTSESVALTDAEVATISVPALFMVGTLDGLQSKTMQYYDLISHKPSTFRADVIGANHVHFAFICKLGNWLIYEQGEPIDEWSSLLDPLVPLYLSTCVPPALGQDRVDRLLHQYAAAFFLMYISNQSYASYLSQDQAINYEPLINFWGDVGGPIPALPSAWMAPALGAVMLVAGGFFARRRRGR